MVVFWLILANGEIMDKDKIQKLRQKCSSLRVLYAEDDLNVRLQTQKMLNTYFQEVTCAKDGKEAFKLYKSGNFDLIFTDINMANMDGLTLIESIRSINKDLPIVVFSAYDNSQYLLKTIKLGVQGYLIKPFTLNEIIETLDKIIYHLNKTKETLLLKDGFYWLTDLEKLFYKNGNEAKLTKHELSLFKLFLSSKSQIFSSDIIEIEIFDDDISDNKRVRNLISRLKHKLKSDLIENIYGEGYRISWQTN